MATQQQIYYCDMTLRQVFPLLNEIAIQNGLKLSRIREFKIAKKILINSIVKN